MHMLNKTVHTTDFVCQKLATCAKKWDITGASTLVTHSQPSPGGGEESPTFWIGNPLKSQLGRHGMCHFVFIYYV